MYETELYSTTPYKNTHFQTSIISFYDPALKNQSAKYLEVTSYILLSLYSFLDWLSEEAKSDGVHQVTSVDESNDEFDSLHTVKVTPLKRLIGRESSFCGEKKKQ